MADIKEQCVILGGVHGDDKLGVEVLTHFFKHPNPTFQLLLGNYKAVEENKKFIDFDMLKAGKGDVTCETSIEKCRAGELHEVLVQFDHVVDIHGSHENKEDLLILTNNDLETLRFAKAMGVAKAILIPKNNYLTESVRHPVTLLKRVEAKPDPTPQEIAECVLRIERLEKFFNNEHLPNPSFGLYEITVQNDNLIDYIINNDVSDLLQPLET